MSDRRLNMASPDVGSDWTLVPEDKTKLAVNILLGSAYSWGTDVVTLQSTPFVGLDEDGNTLEDAQAFLPGQTLSSSKLCLTNIPVAGLGYIRAIATTTSGSGDPTARLLLRFE